MKLTPELKFIQEKLVLAAHPGLSLEDAERSEVGEGCIFSTTQGANTYYDVMIEDKTEFSKVVFRRLGIVYGEEYQGSEDNETLGSTSIWVVEGDIVEGFEGLFLHIDEIIGLPPTLSRVLIALEQFKWVEEMLTYNFNFSSTSGERISRKLLNDDGSDATLFDQSPETITAIAREIGYKSE